MFKAIPATCNNTRVCGVFTENCCAYHPCATCNF